MNFKKLWADYGIGAVIVLLFIAYGVHLLGNYMTRKASYGYENYSNNSNPAYTNSSAPPQPNNLGESEFSKVNYPSKQGNTVQNPNDLLPKSSGGNGNQWSSLNPNGKGELANVNLLRAGYHVGIDTVGQTLRNANLQLRSEPPNPQNNVGPWNNTTIVPETYRVPFELGQGGK